MPSESDNSSLSTWKPLLKEHFGILATISLFLFVTLQILIITRGNTFTANFIIAHSDKISLFIGIFLPFFPILFVLFILTMGRIGFLALDSNALITFQALLAAGLFTVSIIERLMTWQTLILALVLSYLVLDFPFPPVFRNKGIGKFFGIPDRKSGKGVFRKNVVVNPIVFLTFLIIIALKASPIYSFPLECITQSDGTKRIAAVLSVDDNYTYLLALGGRKPIVLKSSQISSRLVAKTFGDLACEEPSASKK